MKQIIIVTCCMSVVLCAFSGCLRESEPCIPATRENGRYDVNDDGAIDSIDSEIILFQTLQVRGETYVYNQKYDMNCDGIVDLTDVDLCVENRD